MDKKDIERDKRLRKTYGISLAQYNEILALQGGVCAICGRAPKADGMPLVVDHEHFKIEIYKPTAQIVADALKKYPDLITPDALSGIWGKEWLAIVSVNGHLPIAIKAKTKVAAMAEAKQKALPLSVRGLLCPGRHGKAGHGCCNRLLGRVDNIDWLQKSIEYLKDPPARKVIK